MKAEVAARLVAVNREFYRRLAAPFGESRGAPQPGYPRLLPWLPPAAGLLDVGCGNGRFGRFLQQHDAITAYSGVDFSEVLLAEAAATVPGDYHQCDLSQPGCLDGLGTFDAVACLSALQHLPGRANRVRLLREMASHLRPDGRLFLVNWQFLDSPRQRRKILSWEQAGLDPADLEAGDYLLSWQRGGSGYRYVAYIGEAETAELAAAAGLTILDQFHSDGKEGNLNLYTVLAAAR